MQVCTNLDFAGAVVHTANKCIEQICTTYMSVYRKVPLMQTERERGRESE